MDTSANEGTTTKTTISSVKEKGGWTTKVSVNGGEPTLLNQDESISGFNIAQLLNGVQAVAAKEGGGGEKKTMYLLDGVTPKIGFPSIAYEFMSILVEAYHFLLKEEKHWSFYYGSETVKKIQEAKSFLFALRASLEKNKSVPKLAVIVLANRRVCKFMDAVRCPKTNDETVKCRTIERRRHFQSFLVEIVSKIAIMVELEEDYTIVKEQTQDEIMITMNDEWLYIKNVKCSEDFEDASIELKVDF